MAVSNQGGSGVLATSIRGRGPATRNDYWIAYSHAISKTMEYPMSASTISEEQWKEIYTIINMDVLPRAGLVRSLGHDVLYGPIKYQGLGKQSAYHTQELTHLKDFVEQVNHWGTDELVYAAEESGVKHFVYSSSVGVYGSSSSEMDESTNPNPRTFYAISKHRGEEHVSRLSEKMKTHIIRCGNIFGYSRSMRFDSVINKFVFESNFSNRISIHGNGKQYRSFAHVDYVADTFNRLLTSSVPSGIYNLVELNISVLDIVDVLKEVNPELEFIFINQHLKLRNIKVSTDLKLAGFMELKEKTDFKEIIRSFHDRFSF